MGSALRDASGWKTPALIGGVVAAGILGVVLWRARRRRKPGSLGATLGRVSLGRGRAFEATGRPRSLGRVDDYGPTQSATLYVGRNRGHEPANRRGSCARAPETYSLTRLDDTFLAARAAQVGRKDTGATRTTGKGWYKGDPESAAAYAVIHIPNDREQSYEAFRQNMNRLAETMAQRLCQDSVIVVHDDGDRKKSCGAEWWKPGTGDC